MSASRERFVKPICMLLEVQGFQATGLKQIIGESQAPKRSLYYYFPGERKNWSWRQYR